MSNDAIGGRILNIQNRKMSNVAIGIRILNIGHVKMSNNAIGSRILNRVRENEQRRNRWLDPEYRAGESEQRRNLAKLTDPTIVNERNHIARSAAAAVSVTY